MECFPVVGIPPEKLPGGIVRFEFIFDCGQSKHVWIELESVLSFHIALSRSVDSVRLLQPVGGAVPPEVRHSLADRATRNRPTSASWRCAPTYSQRGYRQRAPGCAPHAQAAVRS